MALSRLFGTAEAFGGPLREVGRAKPSAARESVPRFGRFALAAALFRAVLNAAILMPFGNG